MTNQASHPTLQRIATQVASIMRGQDKIIRRIIAAWVAGSHVLLEDAPGTGKTTLAKALARSVDARFSRIQFTPDLLPSDIVGVSIYDQHTQRFDYHEGPVFANVVLADEINRASPRTQSALLEAMAEAQVTVDGQRRGLPDPYFVIATQNPIESHGTYPLPEAQMDRFGLRLSLGYIAPDEEVRLLDYRTAVHPVDGLSACASLADLRQARQAAAAIEVAPSVRDYIVALVGATRQRAEIRMGASPRASITLFQLARALALVDGRDFVTPDLVQDVAIDVLAHRLVIDEQARFSGQTAAACVQKILGEIPVPA